MRQRNFEQVTTTRELKVLQRAFSEMIMRPLGVNDSMVDDPRASEMIAPSRRLTPQKRLELYAQQYWWRLQNSLDEDFPLLRTCLGQNRYEKLRDSYIHDRPSRSFTLRNFGLRLPEYIARHAKLTYPLTVLARDCARFECSRIEAFDGAELPSLRVSHLGRRGFMKAPLGLQPHLQLLKLSYPINELVRASQPAQESGASNVIRRRSLRTGQVGRRIRPRATFLVVHRYRGRVLMKEISGPQFAILRKLQRGVSLSVLLSSKDRRNSSEELFASFKEWSALGWIVMKQCLQKEK